MDHQIRQVVPSAIQTEELEVEHVRYPRDRKPVSGVRGGKRPAQSGQRQAVLNMSVADNCLAVVEVDEFKIVYLKVHDQSESRER